MASIGRCTIQFTKSLPRFANSPFAQTSVFSKRYGGVYAAQTSHSTQWDLGYRCFSAQAAKMEVVVLSKIPGLTEALTSKTTSEVSCSLFDPLMHPQDKITNAEVLVADPDLIIPYLNKLEGTKWISMTWAGVEGLIAHIKTMESRPTAKITRFAGFFGEVMAEHVIGTIIMRERGFGTYVINQRSKVWKPQREYRLLRDLSIGILGVGEIGKAVARTCMKMNMNVKGVVRTIPKKEDRIDGATYFTFDDLDDVLSSCDYVCNILPSTSHTKGKLNGKLHLFKSDGCFINVGRGDIVDEDELADAVSTGQLGGAILDVFSTEPLPTTSRLWNTPGIFVTPHVSAVSFASHIAEGFAANMVKFNNNASTLRHEVDFDAGY
eukprot:m.207366 g.207366  ORF g.207366 m.207366 type:complete len:379 (-) comp32983_c0_seq1:147-1283(-)